MPVFHRKLQPVLERMLSAFRVVYLAGARQAGKTTLARSIADNLDMDYISLDEQALLAAVRSDPYGFIQSMGSRKIVLDEFQYVPELIPVIKKVSDLLAPDEKGKFLLTGSADIFRSARVQEALPGHMARFVLYPLSAGELSVYHSGYEKPNLIDYLCAGEFPATKSSFISRQELAAKILSGGYPEVQSLGQREKQVWFKSYLAGRLYKDFETLHAARGDYQSKLQALLPYLAGLSGNLLKYSRIGRDLELKDGLVKTYTEMLELMFLLQRVPAYRKNRARISVSQMPKLHFIDTGLAGFLLGYRDPEQLVTSQHYGALLESLIYMELCKQAGWSQEDVVLYHFRDKRQSEVDIVLEKSNLNIIGIEIKASATVSIRDFKGLSLLAEATGNKFERGVLLYSGEDTLSFRYGRRRFYALPVSLFI